MGPGFEYTTAGTLTNALPLARRPGFQRVLFVGDSVTARATLVRPLSANLTTGTTNVHEVFNAGVEGYDFWQITQYFLTYNQSVAPDHVIYTLHNNDLFFLLPVVSFDTGNAIIFGPPNGPHEIRLPPLLGRSDIWRRLAIRRWKHAEVRARTAAFRDDLEHFHRTLSADGIELSIVLFPVLKPLDQWTDEERRSRSASLAALAALKIRYVDVWPALERAIDDGTVLSETPGDIWHPSEELARQFVLEIQSSGILNR